jgi:hypothetical protein
VKKTPVPGVSVHVCNPSYLGGRDVRIMSSRPAQSKVVGLSPNKILKKIGGIAQMAEYIPSIAFVRPCVQSPVLKKKKCLIK